MDRHSIGRSKNRFVYDSGQTSEPTLRNKEKIRSKRIYLSEQAWLYIVKQIIVNNHLIIMNSVRTKSGMIRRSP